MSKYQYVLSSLASGTVIGEPPMSNVSFSRVLNDIGGFSGECPLSLVEPETGLELMQAGDFDGRLVALHVIRDGVVVWGGMLTGWQASVNDDKLSVAAQGFFQRFTKLPITTTQTFAQVDQFTIVESIVTAAQAGAANFGVTVTKVPAAGSGILRDRTYLGSDRAWSSDLIKNLSQVVNGFDFELVAGGTYGNFTRTLQLWYPQMGRDTGLVWETGGNLQILNYANDYGDWANRVDELGAGDGDLMMVGSASDPTLAALPSQVRTVARKTVKETATLQQHAVTELAKIRNGKRTLGVQIVNLPDSPFGSYIPGDIVHIRAQHGFVQLNEDWRIMQYTVTPDDAGSEVVAVDLAPLEAFVTDNIEDPA